MNNNRTTEQAMREAFEAWVKSETCLNMQDMVLRRLMTGEYQYQPTFAGWRAWQAAQATPQPQSVTVTDSNGGTDYEYVAGPDRKGGVAVFVKGHDYLKVIYDALIEPLSAAPRQESEAQAEPIHQVYEPSTQTWMDATLNYYNTAMRDGLRCRIVYPAPPSALAIDAAAKMQAAEVAYNLGGNRCDTVRDAVLATIPQDGITALAEVFDKVLNCYSPDDTVTDYQDKIRSIVVEIMGEGK